MEAKDNPATKMLYLSEEQVIAMLYDEKMKGIREVVGWIKIYSGLERCDPDVMAYFEDYRLFNEDEWQAKLKEWGISNE